MTTAIAIATTSKNRSHVSILAMSYFVLIFCFIFLSHPPFFSCFTSLLAYFLKFLSFLSPLFITTSLVLLVLVTVSPGLIIIDDKKNSVAAKAKLAFLAGFAFRGFLEKSRPNAADDEKEGFVQASEGFEVYKILFEVPDEVKVGENVLEGSDHESKHEAPLDKFLITYGDDGMRDDVKIGNSERNLSEGHDKISMAREERSGGRKTKTLEGLFLGNVETEDEILDEHGEEKEAKQWDPRWSKSNKVGEENGSDNNASWDEELAVADNLKVRDDFSKARQLYGFTRLGGSLRLTSDGKFGYEKVGLDNVSVYVSGGGSMRREKERGRTLACKLYEERNDDDEIDSEGMDLLWETYEDENDSNIDMHQMQTTKSYTKKSKTDYDDDDNEEEEEEKLCCLQVLKFSAGKIGRPLMPNLLVNKISKAFTFRGAGMGMGWFHHHHHHVIKRGRKKI